MNHRSSASRQVLSRWCAALLTIAAVGSAALGASKAALITGHDSPEGQAQMNKVAAIASPQYSAKGYGVVNAMQATKAGIIGALSDPGVTHVMFCMHGVGEEGEPFEAKLWIGPGTGPEHYLGFQEVIDLIPLNRRCAIKQVVMNCCGQLKPEWQQAFPCATIHGWTTSVTFWSAKWDQWWHGSERTSPKGGSRGDTGPGLIGLPFDGRIAGAVPFVFHPEIPGIIHERWWDPVAYPWRMPLPLRSDFGARRFQLVVGDFPADEILLGTFDVVGGEVIGFSDDPLPGHHFVVRFTHAAYETAIGNIDTLPGLFMSGAVTITENTSGVIPPILAAGSFVVLFGFGSEVAPPCLGDADGNDAVDFGDITSVLANFGSSGPPFGPGDADGNGVVNFADISTVLANWGASC